MNQCPILRFWVILGALYIAFIQLGKYIILNSKIAEFPYIGYPP